MNTDFFQLLLNSSGAALVTGLFIFYLIKKDRRDEHKEERFNGILQDYLKESISVKKELAEKMQRNTDVLEQNTRIIDQMETILSAIKISEDGKVPLFKKKKKGI